MLRGGKKSNMLSISQFVFSLLLESLQNPV